MNKKKTIIQINKYIYDHKKKRIESISNEKTFKTYRGDRARGSR